MKRCDVSKLLPMSRAYLKRRTVGVWIVLLKKKMRLTESQVQTLIGELQNMPTNVSQFSHSLQSREVFVNNCYRRGNLLFGWNASPAESEEIPLEIQGYSQIRTWQDLRQSKEWFYASMFDEKGGKENRRHFLFAFTSGVLLISKLFRVDGDFTRSWDKVMFCAWQDFLRLFILRMSGLRQIEISFNKFDLSSLEALKDWGYSNLDYPLTNEEVHLEAFQKLTQSKIAIYIQECQQKQSAVVLESYNPRLQELKGELKSQVDKDNNNVVDLIESNIFLDSVKENQNRIQEIDGKFVQNFVKLENHLRTRRESIEAIYNHQLGFAFDDNLASEKDADSALNRWEGVTDFLKSEMKLYTVMQYNAIHMVSALLCDDLFLFYEIYEAFDRLEIWHSEYEKVSTAQLKSFNQNVIKLIEATQNSTFEIANALGDLTERLSDQNDKLENIHGAVTAGNLLSAVNTFQLHRISKNTKSLHE